MRDGDVSSCCLLSGGEVMSANTHSTKDSGMKMSQIDGLWKRYAVVPREPFRLPDFLQPCDHCERDTGTKVLFMRQGLGNACAICGRLRRGKPYLSKRDFETLKLQGANGGSNEATTV